MTPKTAELKSGLEARRSRARERHDRGGGGLEVSSALCAAVDETIIELFERERGDFGGALVALGGYGRGLLNPFSDIDLLFLLKGSSGAAAPPPHSLLAMLWDIGLKVGHSARTIDDTVTMGLSDLTARTSMMEARLLTGSRELFDEFHKKYERKVVRHKPGAFMALKIEETKRRHAVHGRTVHLTEPDMKESRGGLRDYHTAMWLLRSKADVWGLDEMTARGIVGPADAKEVERAHSVLLRLRNALHWRAGKALDRLVQPLQPDIARGEGLEGSDNAVAAELMRRYYEAAETIDRFSREMILFAREYRKMRPWRPISVDNDGLFTDGTSLHARSFPPERLGGRPALLFRIARRLAEENLKPAPNLWRGLRKIAETAPAEWFEGPEAGRMLMAVLRLKNSARAVSVFLETGILERLIPEFSHIRRLTQFDMFHKYTADKHTINTVRMLESLPENRGVGLKLREIFRAEDHMEVIKLALLLHDLGKRAEDRHAVEEDTRTPVILKRLGLERLEERVGFLVRNHLLMSRVAQRRDFSIPTTLRRFCEDVGDRDALRRLYLLTYADIAGVGPEVWSDWKDYLLSELFESAEKFFIEGEAFFLSPEESIESLTQGITALPGPAVDEKTARDFLERAPSRYLRNATLDTVVDDIRLVKTLRTKKLALSYRSNPGDSTGRITLAAAERLGFFSVIAGAFAAKNVNVTEAQIHTFEGHMALDAITVAGPSLSLFSDPASLAAFEKELVAFLEGKKDVDKMVKRRARYMRPEPGAKAPGLEPRVVILNHLSRISTVVEIWAPDRIGLLYDITHTLARLGLDINGAKISTEGKRAINVFYVTDEEGNKLEGEENGQRVREALISAIESPPGR
ncbi:MAG: [protein-PII] uridylyltransferase [Candidatus Nitrospinota bacterium M3_3B_026]